MVCIAVFFCGMASGLMVPFLINSVANVAPAVKKSMALSLVSAGMLLGSFLTSGTAAILDSLVAANTRMEFAAIGALLAAAAVVAGAALVIRGFRLRSEPGLIERKDGDE